MRWGTVLGFALGGFFDGILLHQILQWHHLLSAVDGMADLRGQVLWDGYFHALMYVIAAIGLWGLWRAHRAREATGGRTLFGAVLVGFGLWHVADSILSHWVLGIHRIKMDGDNLLLWDLIWFFAFGVVPLVVGWLMLRAGDRSTGTGRLAGSALSVLLAAALTVGMGAVALRPPQDQPFTTVVFKPGSTQQEVFGAISKVDSRLLWADASSGVVVIAMAPERKWTLYRHGALLVSGSGLPAGCFDWSKV